MGILVVHAQRVFPGQQGLFRIARLRQRLVFQRAQRGEGDVLRIDQIRRSVHETIRHALQCAKVRQVERERGVQLVTVRILEAGSIARKGRLHLFIRRTQKHQVGRTAGGVGGLHRGLHQRFRERTGRTCHGSGVGRRYREGARSAHRALSDPAGQASGLTSRTQSSGVERLVLNQGNLGIALQLLDALDLLIGHFRLAASLVYHFLSVSNDKVLVADLGVITPARGRTDGLEGRDVIAFDLGVVGGGGQGVGLPLVETSLSLDLLQGRLKRGFGRRNVVDDIRQVFTLADRGVGRESIGDHSHDSILIESERADRPRHHHLVRTSGIWRMPAVSGSA